jgi:phosphopantetheinyl transferase
MSASARFATCEWGSVEISMSHSSDLVEVLVDSKVSRPFIGLVAGVGVDIDAESHRTTVPPKPAAFCSDWL